MKIKFGDTIKKKMIPEWHNQYADYRSLKKTLKLLKKFSQQLVSVKFSHPNIDNFQIINYT
jgi:SPX domain protein involved in polyphosphate accumulation